MPRTSGFLQQYVAPLGGGTAIFIVVAIVLLVPYVIVQYNRRGRVGARRTFVEATFLLYLLCAWALVLLPLPDLTGEFCSLRHVSPQITPFNWVHDTWRQWSGTGGEPLDLLRSKALWVRIFNVLLLVPLGVYLRRWWRRGFWVTAIAGLGMSLAFELTQLTGLWHLYPCAYRTFDVDDLIANTAGAMLGWVIAPLILVLPSRREQDDAHPTREHASIPRRFVADLVDVLLVVLIAVPLSIGLRLLQPLKAPAWGETDAAALVGDSLALLIVVWLIPVMASGRTPGKWLVRLRISRIDGVRAAWWQVLVRSVLLWLPMVVPLWLIDAVNVDTITETPTTVAWLVVLLAAPWLWIVTVMATVLARADDRGPHELASTTWVAVTGRED